MVNIKPINSEIGFADSEIVSYRSENDNLVIEVKSWNDKTVNLEFEDCIFFLISNSWYISEICEANDSIYKEMALNKVYEKIPAKIPYRFFQFLDLDDDPSVEIIARDFQIYR